MTTTFPTSTTPSPPSAQTSSRPSPPSPPIGPAGHGGPSDANRPGRTAWTAPWQVSAHLAMADHVAYGDVHDVQVETLCVGESR